MLNPYTGCRESYAETRQLGRGRFKRHLVTQFHQDLQALVNTGAPIQAGERALEYVTYEEYPDCLVPIQYTVTGNLWSGYRYVQARKLGLAFPR